MVGARRIAAAACLLLSACSGDDGLTGAKPDARPGTFEVRGTIAVPSATYVAKGQEPGGFCSVKDGYEDVRTGASVAVTNAKGDVVGVAALVDTDRTPEDCRYAFDVPNVPDGDGTYGIEVASRGVVQYDRAELDQEVELPVK